MTRILKKLRGTFRAEIFGQEGAECVWVVMGAWTDRVSAELHARDLRRRHPFARSVRVRAYEDWIDEELAGRRAVKEMEESIRTRCLNCAGRS